MLRHCLVICRMGWPLNEFEQGLDECIKIIDPIEHWTIWPHRWDKPREADAAQLQLSVPYMFRNVDWIIRGTDGKAVVTEPWCYLKGSGDCRSEVCPPQKKGRELKQVLKPLTMPAFV